MRTFGHLVSTVAVLALLAGCATTESQLHTRETLGVATNLKQVAASPAAPMDTSSVQVKADAYVGAEVARNDNGEPLPAKWEKQNIDIARAGAASFQDVAAALTKATGIPVAVSTAGSGDVAGLNNQVGVPASADSTGGSVGLADGPIPDGFPVEQALQAIASQNTTSQSGTVAGGASLGIDGTMRLNYAGKLRGFLDLVSSNFNIGWEYRGGRILFSTTITRVFDVPALPILAQLSFKMESGSTVGGTSGGSSAAQSAETKGGFDLWTDLGNTLGGIVANSGVYKMSSQTGQVIVVAPPSTVDRVASYLKQLNAQLNKQVAISVNVYSVAVSDNDDYAANVTALFPNAGAFDLKFTGVGTSSNGGLGWAVVDGGNQNGSNGVLQALSSRHDVSTVTSASVTALNGVPVPVQVANTQAYAKSVTVNVSDNGVSGSVEPGEVTTGFNLHLVPKILGNGTVLLQYGMNLSELNAITNFEVPGGGSIQLPNVTQRNFIQQAQIPNGNTLVLAGYEQVTASNQSSGPVHSGLWPFGGSRKGSMSRNVIVIAITPVVLDISPSAQARYGE